MSANRCDGQKGLKRYEGRCGMGKAVEKIKVMSLSLRKRLSLRLLLILEQ